MTLLQLSLREKVLIKVKEQDVPLVLVFITFAVSEPGEAQLSLKLVGLLSDAPEVEHSTVWSPGKDHDGLVVSLNCICCAAVADIPQGSVATQVLVIVLIHELPLGVLSGSVEIITLAANEHTSEA